MARDYDDDPSKEKSRFEIYKFADKYLPKDRSEATALYMASTNNRETQVLDKLGFPRSGRIILESDLSKVPEVKSKNPGIEVLPLASYEFLRSEHRKHSKSPFWYIGLDYECMLNEQVLNDIQNIAVYNLLLDGGILYTNLVGVREQTERKKDYMEMFIKFLHDGDLMQEIFGEEFDYETTAKRLANELYGEGVIQSQDWYSEREHIGLYEAERFASLLEREMIRFFPKAKLGKLRSYAITRAIHSYLHFQPPGITFEGESACLAILSAICEEHISTQEKAYLKDILRDDIEILFNESACPGGFEVAKMVLGEYELTPEDRRLLDIYEQEGIFARKISTIWDHLVSSAIENRGRIRELGRNLQRNALEYYRKGNLENIVLLFPHLLKQGYVVTDDRSFYYTSNKNIRMMLDLMHVKKIAPHLEETLNFMIENDFAVYYTWQRPYLGRMMEVESVERMLAKLKVESPRLVRQINKRIGFLKYFDRAYTSQKAHIRRSLGSSFIPAVIKAEDTENTLNKPKKSTKKTKKVKNQKEHQLPGSRFLVPRKVYMSLSQEYKARINQFNEEVTSTLSKKRQANLRVAFLESNANKYSTEFTEPIRFYAFFDDIMLYIKRKKKIPKPHEINSILRQVANADKLYEITSVYRQKPTKPVKRPKLSEEQNNQVYEYIDAGFTNEEIAIEFGISPGQVRARRSWHTMRGAPEKAEIKIPEITDEEIFKDIISEMLDEEIMKKYGIPKTKLAGKKMVLTKRGIKWRK